MALLFKGLHTRIIEPLANGLRLIASAKFEMLLAVLLLLTAAAVVWREPLLERTMSFTPANTQPGRSLFESDRVNGGQSDIRENGTLSWSCDLRGGDSDHTYCGYELFFDANRGSHGLDLTHMRTLTIKMVYRGPSTTFRIYLKNFDPRYSRSARGETSKFLQVEAATTPGKFQTTEFEAADFNVADWWITKFNLPARLGRAQFDNVTSLSIQTGTKAPVGHHEFEVSEIIIRKAILSDAQWYSLLLGIWIVMIIVYLGYRIGNMRSMLKERQTLESLALNDAREAANHDHLTRILNRRGMVERFNDLLKDREEAVAVTVILIDIDHFKRLNDTYGHDYGDQVLSNIAGVISRNVRAHDIVARWGGEEFMVVCVDVDRRAAQRIAEQIRDRIENADFGECGPITASFGIHWSYAPDPELPRLVSLADIALYAAKANGRNCVRLHRPGMSKAA